MIFLWSVYSAIGGVYWWIKARRAKGMVIYRPCTVVSLFPDLGYMWDWAVEIWSWSWRFWESILTRSRLSKSKSEQLLLLPRGELVFWGRLMSVFRDVSVVAKCFWAFIFLCWSTVFLFGYLLPLPICCCLIVLLVGLAN